MVGRKSGAEGYSTRSAASRMDHFRLVGAGQSRREPTTRAIRLIQGTWAATPVAHR